jgi:hypothetical protein
MGLVDRPTAAQDKHHLLRSRVALFLLRTTSMLFLLTCAYYVWPARSPASDVSSAARLAAALLAAGLVAFVVRAERRAVRRDPRPLRYIEALLATLYFLVVVFAAVYHAIAVRTDQFAGLETKTDGLYFTVTIISTVGFGDIHAVGTAARALVTAQMLFGIIYIGTVIRVLSGLGSRLQLPRDPDPPPA